jgi:hypothetical protein
MKNPPELRFIALGLVTGTFLVCSPIAEGEEITAVKPTGEKEVPHLLLADVWNSSINPTGWWMSEKYDGLRGYWDGRTLWSRKGQVIHAPSYFLAELPRDVALDGELWIARGKFEECQHRAQTHLMIAGKRFTLWSSMRPRLKALLRSECNSCARRYPKQTASLE